MKKILVNVYFVLGSILFLLLGIWFGKEAIDFLPYFHDTTDMAQLVIRDSIFSLISLLLCVLSVVLFIWINNEKIKKIFKTKKDGE